MSTKTGKTRTFSDFGAYVPSATTELVRLVPIMFFCINIAFLKASCGLTACWRHFSKIIKIYVCLDN